MYENLDEPATELLASAEYCAPLPPRTRPGHLGAVRLTVRAPAPCDTVDGAVHRAPHRSAGERKAKRRAQLKLAELRFGGRRVA